MGMTATRLLPALALLLMIVPTAPGATSNTPEANSDGGWYDPAGHTAGPADTSEYFYGRVAVTVFFVESNGSAEIQTEDWTAPELALAQSEIADALAWWAALEPNASLSFDLAFEFYNVSIEPINHVCGWDPGGAFSCEDTLWVGDVMAQKGYTGPVSARARAYLNDLRVARGTPWAAAVFVIDSEADTDGVFIAPGGGTSAFAYSYFGGPYLFMTSDNGAKGPALMDEVMAHEFGHTFYATDEYNGLSESSGYFAAGDNEGSGCLMDTGLPTCLSLGTREQIGWRDSDTDGILDVLDVDPDTLLTLTPPTLNPGVNLTFGGTTTIAALPNLNPQDPGADIQLAAVTNISYRIDGGPWVLLPAADGALDSDVESFAFNLTLASGPHTVEVCATSDVGNVDPSCALHAFTVDTTLPDSAVISPVPALWNTTMIPVAVAASDDVNVASVELWSRKDGGNWTLFGNDAVWPYAFTFDATPTGDGFYEFHSIATDDAGNVEPAPALPDANVTVDTTPPVTTLNPPALTAWYTTDLLESFAVTGGPATTSFRVDGGTWLSGVSVTFTTEGTHTLEYYSVDVAGNVEALRNATFRLDKTLPTSTLAPLVNLTNDLLVVLNWSATDMTSGVDLVEIYYRQAGPFLWQLHGTDDASPYNFTAASNGTYEFFVVAQDLAGLREPAPIVITPAQAWITIDTRTPGAAPNALPLFINSPQFTVTVLTDEDIGIAVVELWASYNGGNFTILNTSTEANVTFSLDARLLDGQGQYGFYAIAEDLAGNRQPTPITGINTTVDYTPPVVSIETPDASPEWTFITNPLFSWTMIDPVSGIGSVQVRVDSGLWIDVGTATSYTLNLPGDGTYTLSVRATDRAGNLLDPPVQRTIQVDATAPAFTILEPGANATSANGTMVVRWIVLETASGVDSVRIRLGDNEFLVTGDNWTFTNLPEGSYSLLITATDGSGQVGQTTVTWLVTPADGGDPNASPFNIWAWVLLLVVVVFVLAILLLMKGRKKARPFEELDHMQPVGAEVDTGHGLAETPEAPPMAPRPRRPKKTPPRQAPEPEPEQEETEEPVAEEPVKPVERSRRDDVL